MKDNANDHDDDKVDISTDIVAETTADDSSKRAAEDGGDDQSSSKRKKVGVKNEDATEVDVKPISDSKKEEDEPVSESNKVEGEANEQIPVVEGRSDETKIKKEDVIQSNDKGAEDERNDEAKKKEAPSDLSSPSAIESGDGNIDSGFMSFPEKIMMLLTKNMVKDAMWWLPDGDAFCILPAPFTEKVLDQHFQGTKFESFTRKLNRWGFKRVAGDGIPANAIAFYHNFFQKDRPELLKDMSGGKSKNAANNGNKKSSTKGKGDLQNSDHKSDKKCQGDSSPGAHVKRDHSGGANVVGSDAAMGNASFHDGSRGSVDQSLLRRELLAQQLGGGFDPTLNDSLLLEQILRARGASHLAADSLRGSEMDKILSSAETARLLGQQRDSLLQSNMAADNTRLLLQQLASSSASSDLAARLLAQRGGGLGSYGSRSITSVLLDQMRANQMNTDAELALRILAQQRGRGEVGNAGLASALARQQLASGTDSLGLSGNGDLQSRLLLPADRLRASQGRDSSSEVLNRLMWNSNDGGSSSLYDSADMRSRLLNPSLGNPRLSQLLQSDPNLSDQQVYELLLMQQQRDGLSRLGGDVGSGSGLDR